MARPRSPENNHLPPFVSAFPSQHGTVRYQFRRTGQKAYYFTADPGTEAFKREYQACMDGQPIAKASAPNRPRIGVRAVVYFIAGHESGPIKIGHTRNLAKRMQALQNAAAEPLVVMAAIDGGREIEVALHKRFASLRMNGEWFRPGPDLMSLISELREGKCLIHSTGGGKPIPQTRRVPEVS